MSESSITNEVRVLVENLAARWNGGSEIWAELIQAAGGGEISPYEAYRQLGADGLERIFGSSEGKSRIDAAYTALTKYLTQESWFDRQASGDSRLAYLKQNPVAYMCMEYGFEDWLPIYSGGLGVLAGDVLKESSDLGLPLVAVGLFYRHGFFSQRMDAWDYQNEEYPTLDPEKLPLSPVLDEAGDRLIVEVPVDGRVARVQAWLLKVGRVRLYLMDTDVAGNDDALRELTAGLYGGDARTRIQQEMVLGIGGVRLLRALGIEPSVFSMNEGHSAFLGLELLADELKTSDWDTSLSRTRSRIVYTNHTVVPAGNDVFGLDLVHQYLGPYADGRGIPRDRLIGLATRGPDEGFSMAVLAFNLSGKANAVSQLHGDVVRSQWPGFEVEAVTNGVHIPTWAGPAIQNLLNSYLPDWRGDNPDWHRVQDIPDEKIFEARSAQREALVEFANETLGSTLNPDALTIVWARRFAEYKRAGLLASDMQRLQNLISQADRPVQIIISGKSHPRDEGGKRMMQALLRTLEENAEVAPHFVFVPDYRISVGRTLTRGADVWLNTPRKPLEASGTSGMKSSDNGGLQLTVQDGWAAEVSWWQVGWGIEGRDDYSDAQQMYYFLESSIVPSFYNRDEKNVPHQWCAMAKNTMEITLSRYSARRMMLEYLNKLYLPLVEQQQRVNVPA